MDLTSSLAVPRPAAEVFAAVEDLGDYPGWLSIVARAEPAPADPDDVGPAWLVELRGRLGPLARSKRLRMVRTVHESPSHLRFERRELDGRNHSAWVLDAVIDADTDTDTDELVTLTMGLHYGGSFGGSLLERMLRQEVEQSKPRLLARLTTPA